MADVLLFFIFLGRKTLYRTSAIFIAILPLQGLLKEAQLSLLKYITLFKQKQITQFAFLDRLEEAL